MPDQETWGTFSAYDHRTPIFRQSLALFDKIVAPIPSSPFEDQTQEEFDQLSADIAYLERNQAAVRFHWKDAQFLDWRKPLLTEALAGNLNRDPLQDSRLTIAEEIHAPGVQAIPVYPDAAKYGSSRQTFLENVVDPGRRCG